MKHLLLAAGLLLAAPLAAVAQFTPPPVDSTSGKITYTSIIQVPGATQAQLYGRALKWLATIQAYTAAGPTVKNATSGILSVRVGLPFTGKAAAGSIPCTLWQQLSLTIKEGKAQFKSSAFEVQPYATSTAGLTSPGKTQIAVTPAEDILNRRNSLYFTKQGEPKAYAASVVAAISDQAAAELASLRSALLKPNDF